MNKQTLYRLFNLPRIIEQKKLEIQRIQEQLDVKSPSLTGMPHAGGVHDKVGDGVVELVTKKEELEELVRGYLLEKAETEAWIDAIEDLQVQLIFCYRFKEKMTWTEVADKMGGINTDDSCRKMVDRYLEKGARENEQAKERNQ
jgi:hypothetical protein